MLLSGHQSSTVYRSRGGAQAGDPPKPDPAHPVSYLLTFHILQDIKPRTLSTSSINTIRRSFTIKLNIYPEERNSSFLKAYVLDRFGGGKGLMNEFKSSSRLYWKNHP